MVSSSNVAYNANGNPASVTSPNPFGFISAYLTAAWNDNLQVATRGYAGGILVYAATNTLSATNPTLINFNYVGVDDVEFTSYGGTPHPGYSGSGVHFAMDNVIVVTNLPGNAPNITLQPSDQTVIVGGTASFSVHATGVPPPVYQWRKGALALNDQTNSTLILASVQTNAAGTYSVIVSNTYGGTISSNAALTVVRPSGLIALLIWDTQSGGTLALSNALANAGIYVVLSEADETGYNGANPSPAAFNAVIHLNGTTYDSDMPLAGQNALLGYVQNGGGYVHGEWDAYDYLAGAMSNMRDLILFDCAGYSEGNVTLNDVPAQAGHPILANVPSSFTFQAGFNIGPAHSFSTNLVTVLMRQGTNDAVAVREFGLGKIVGFHHAGNYESGAAFNTLLNANVQQLYIDAVRWAARPATNPPPIISLQAPVILPDGSFNLWLKHTDGTPMSPSEMADTRVFWTTNIALPFADWQPASSPIVLTNGMLRLEGLNISNAACQFFRVEKSH
jgi:hypothetical protein